MVKLDEVKKHLKEIERTLRNRMSPGNKALLSEAIDRAELAIKNKAMGKWYARTDMDDFYDYIAFLKKAEPHLKRKLSNLQRYVTRVYNSI